MTELSNAFNAWRTLSREMQSRGPWDTERAKRLVRGFYKFNHHEAVLDEDAYNSLRRVDPGIPTWDDLRALLDGSTTASSLQRS